MSEFKFGQQVLVRDHDSNEWRKARYIHREEGRHYVYVGKPIGSLVMSQCKPDPKATEFLSGDIVEVSNDGKNWYKAQYIGYDDDFIHWVNTDEGNPKPFTACRYPKMPTKAKDIAQKNVVPDAYWPSKGDYIFTPEEIDSYANHLLEEQRQLILEYTKKETGLYDEYGFDVEDIYRNAPKPEHR